MHRMALVPVAFPSLMLSLCAVAPAESQQPPAEAKWQQYELQGGHSFSLLAELSRFGEIR